jgi:PIN domain nuclease of toxin-antitoxin system
MLLDTCAALWLANGQPMSKRALIEIRTAQQRGSVFLSTITSWEIGTLFRKGRIELPMGLPDFVDDLFTLPGIQTLSLDRGSALTAARLTEAPRDPVDRMLIATAMTYELQLVTRDAAILAYARGDKAVKVLRC